MKHLVETIVCFSVRKHLGVGVTLLGVLDRFLQAGVDMWFYNSFPEPASERDAKREKEKKRQKRE